VAHLAHLAKSTPSVIKYADRPVQDTRESADRPNEGEFDMRSRLLARVAALVLATGGLLVIPATPAFAHCNDNDHPHPDREGGASAIRWEGQQAGGTPLRHGPHNGCSVFLTAFAGDGIDIHCGLAVAGGNHWLYADRTGIGAGWARDAQLRIEPPADFQLVSGCNDPGNDITFDGAG
jgi:hypothetical protein